MLVVSTKKRDGISIKGLIEPVILSGVAETKEKTEQTNLVVALIGTFTSEEEPLVLVIRIFLSQILN